MDTMKKVYLEKRDDDNLSYKTEMGCFTMNLNDTDFQSVNSVMEEDLGLDDLDTLIQLELDNYTSCFSDIIDIKGEDVGETDLMQTDLYDASPAHSVTFEYLIPEPLIQTYEDHSDSHKQPITTSGEKFLLSPGKVVIHYFTLQSLWQTAATQDTTRSKQNSQKSQKHLRSAQKSHTLRN